MPKAKPDKVIVHRIELQETERATLEAALAGRFVTNAAQAGASLLSGIGAALSPFSGVLSTLAALWIADKSIEEIGQAIDYVYNLAKSDKGMTALDTVRFHLFNPNGNYTLCREWGWKAYEKGGFYLGVNAGSYHYDQLSKLLDMKKPRWWNVNWHINMLYKDAIDWAEKVKEVENRTDEQKAWVEKKLGGK